MNKFNARERLQTFLESENMTQVNLASKLGVSKASVSQWILGKTEPTPSHEKKMAQIFPKLNIYWFWGNDGEDMFRVDTKVINRNSVESYNIENTMLKDKLIYLERLIESKDNQIDTLNKLIVNLQERIL
jgi:transcriptional regulator with XRE-family HTH domain